MDVGKFPHTTMHVLYMYAMLSHTRGLTIDYVYSLVERSPIIHVHAEHMLNHLPGYPTTAQHIYVHSAWLGLGGIVEEKWG